VERAIFRGASSARFNAHGDGCCARAKVTALSDRAPIPYHGSHSVGTMMSRRKKGGSHDLKPKQVVRRNPSDFTARRLCCALHFARPDADIAGHSRRAGARRRARVGARRVYGPRRAGRRGRRHGLFLRPHARSDLSSGIGRKDHRLSGEHRRRQRPRVHPRRRHGESGGRREANWQGHP
jgi:hypothetical protein